MAEYEFEIRHKPGTKNAIMDYLSRNGSVRKDSSLILKDEVDKYCQKTKRWR